MKHMPGKKVFSGYFFLYDKAKKIPRVKSDIIVFLMKFIMKPLNDR